MNPRAQYLIQILDKIGTPLVSAAEGAADDAQTAQIVASLLGKVVETSISMNNALDLSTSDAQDDSLRVALAALAGSLVVDQYKQKGKIPEAPDLNRIQGAMSAVLTFADNFTLSPEHTTRLEKLKADGGVVDPHQINIQYVDALIPVINAIGAFPFGQPEQKLIMDVSDRLVKRTAEMRETLLPGLSGDDEKLAELAILRATAGIYAACHEAETERLTGKDADIPDSYSINPVWDAFETRIAMLEAVAKNIMPEGGPTQERAAAPVAPPVVEAPPVAPEQPPAPPPAAVEETPSAATPEKPAIFQAQPQQNEAQPPQSPQAPVEPPVVSPPPPAQPEQPPADNSTAQGGGPMSFFTKPGADSSDTQPSVPLQQPPQAPVEPPAAPAPPPVQPEQPLPAQPEQTPPQSPIQPPVQPPAEPPQDGDDSSGDDNGGGNPMSFFGKKGD